MLAAFLWLQFFFAAAVSPKVVRSLRTLLSSSTLTFISSRRQDPRIMSIPQTYKRLDLVAFSRDFRQATKVVEGSGAELAALVEKETGSLLLKNNFAAANASDIAFSYVSFARLAIAVV